MAVVTLTDLNQQPSRIARMAEREPVYITKYGRSHLVLQRVEDPVAEMRAAGLIRPRKRAASPVGPAPDLGIPPEQAEAIYSDFLAARSGR